MRLFVTGATGFVGRHIVERLWHEGCHITISDSPSLSERWRQLSQVRIVKLDRLEKELGFRPALEDVDVVVHAAGLAHIKATDAEDTRHKFHDANVVATSRLASAARDNGVKKFIYISSIASVADNCSSGVIDDNTATEPKTEYGRTKLLAEKHVADLQSSGIFAVSLRPPLVVGHDAKGNWARLQRLAASRLPLPFSSVDNKRSFIGVETLSEMTTHLGKSDWPVEFSGDYCVADPEFLSLSETLHDLRIGMHLRPNLFPFPASFLEFAGGVLGRQREMAGLLGDLRIDASRFMGRFRFTPTKSIRLAIQESGLLYAERRKQPR